jgi:hypothetical protein
MFMVKMFVVCCFVQYRAVAESIPPDSRTIALFNFDSASVEASDIKLVCQYAGSLSRNLDPTPEAESVKRFRTCFEASRLTKETREESVGLG